MKSDFEISRSWTFKLYQKRSYGSGNKQHGQDNCCPENKFLDSTPCVIEGGFASENRRQTGTPRLQQNSSRKEQGNYYLNYCFQIYNLIFDIFSYK